MPAALISTQARAQAARAGSALPGSSPAVDGVEDIDLTVRPLQGLSRNVATTYLDSSIKNYTGTNVLGQQQYLVGSMLPFSPKWNYWLSADYRFDGDVHGGPFVGLTLEGRSRSDTTPGGAGIVVPISPANRVYPGLVHPFTTNAFATVNARIGYEAQDGRWKLIVWGKNVFNKYYWTNAVTGFDVSSRYTGMPATYGQTASFKLQ